MESVTSRDGTRIAFTKRGSGPPLLFVHGTTADHTRWDVISERFVDDFTVVAMDRRGRGGSGDHPDYAIAGEGEDVAAVAESLGGEVSVVGHSYGAICALEAVLLTDAIVRLVVYEPPIPTEIAPMMAPDVPARIQQLLDQGRREDALDLFAVEVVRMPEHQLDAFHSSRLWPTRLAMAHTIPRELALDQTYTLRPERFAGLVVPILLLVGGDSPPIFRDAADLLADAVPNVTVVELAGQQHIAMDTAPELFAGEVLAFLKA